MGGTDSPAGTPPSSQLGGRGSQKSESQKSELSAVLQVRQDAGGRGRHSEQPPPRGGGVSLGLWSKDKQPRLLVGVRPLGVRKRFWVFEVMLRGTLMSWNTTCIIKTDWTSCSGALGH